MGIRDFIIFMAFFIAGAAVLAAIAYFVMRLLRKARTATETSDYARFNRELDERLEKRGFTRTLVLGDNFAIDEERGNFFCSYPFGRGMEEAVLPISSITEYRIEPAAAFTVGYLFTYAFVESYPPRKVSRQVHVINDDANERLIAALEKFGATKSSADETDKA